MADYDNGLPPDGTDVTDSKITSLLVDKSATDRGDASRVSSVLVDSEATQHGARDKLSGVLVDKGEAGRDRVMFV